MLNIYKLSLNIPTVKTWERTLRLKKNNHHGIIKHRKKSLTNLKEFILRNVNIKNQLPVVLHKDSLSHQFPIKFFDGKLHNYPNDVCSINLNHLKISRRAGPTVSETENHELIRKMSSLSCKHNMLNHRDNSKGIIVDDDTITFYPNLEKTLDGISLESKIQDYYDEPENKSQDDDYSLRIDEIQEIDKIVNLSIQDVDDNCQTDRKDNL